MHCIACSSYETSMQRRRMKTSITACTKNYNRTKSKYLQWMDFQSIGQLAVVLDPSVVDKYLKAKRIINEILKPEEKSSYQSVNVNNYEEPFYEYCTEMLRKSSSETILTSDTSNVCINAPESIISIKEEILDRKSSIALYDGESLMNDAEMQIVEIPVGSNIVLNPMNNRVTFSQLKTSLINDNDPDVINANVYDSEQQTGSKYVYNPMNNIVASRQMTNGDSDGNNINHPSAVPADIQFVPEEYIIKDEFLNDNYDIRNTFALEHIDMDTNQNVLTLTEPSSKQQHLTILDTIVNLNKTSDDVDLPKSEKINTLKRLIDPFVVKKESTFEDEADSEIKVKTELGENTCAKCNKKFKLIYYLRKHELTCGMSFYYNCLFCTKSSMLSHTIKCHMGNHHVEYVAIYGMKELMEIVIQKRKENKEANSNVLIKVKSNFVSMDNLDKFKKNKRKQTFSKLRNDYIVEVKKEICETSIKEELVFPNVQNNGDCRNETSVSVFKPSKNYVDALCSNCNVYLKNLKSGATGCCPNCQSPLIYKCAVCRKCFSKFLSICGHVKYHPQSDLHQKVTTVDKHYCGYCRYETALKSQLLRHLLGHTREKTRKIKREYSG